MAMESSIVIKVKYEETIRRFNARVVNEKLDLNMNGLREKIFKLFNFAPDSELTLTYLDEDGDAITLVDDEDLLDVVKQDLNPLRIAVSLKAAERSSGPPARSSGNSTPLRSPRVQPPFPNLNSSVSDTLKSVPEPLRETVIKLYSDITSRASSSAPILAELVDGISKMGLSYYQNQASVTQPVKESSFHSGASNGNTMTADGGNPNSNSGVPSLEKNEPQAALNDERTSKATEPKSKSLNQAVDTLAKLTSKLKADQTETLGSSSKGPKAHTMPVKTVGKLTQLNWGTRNGDSSGSSVKVPNDGSRSPFRLMQIPTNEVPPSFSGIPKNALRLIPANECPFSGVPNDPLPPPFEVPLKRSHNHSDGTGTIFHRGVRCDGCGVHPITGPRFISKVKENYDLCSICFAEMGNDADYIRVDRPLTYRHPLSFKGLHDLHARLRPPAAPQVLRGFKLKPGRPKLDSRFIQDVNVLDGTLMAPLTLFTKIWRMRNNGNLIWPQGTQLVWIGGDRLSDRFSVELEISPAGLAVDQELDVAVDFVAPELPGRYISYWRMASPSGQKFGQRVWVLIQVDVSSNLPKKELVHEAFQGLNLNFPPANNGLSGPDIINVNPEPQDALPEPKGSKTAMELVESVADVSQNNEQEAKFPINDSLLVGVGDKSGKTLFAILLMKSLCDDLQKQNKKMLAVFLVPKVPLVYQNHSKQKLFVSKLDIKLVIIVVKWAKIFGMHEGGSVSLKLNRALHEKERASCFAASKSVQFFLSLPGLQELFLLELVALLAWCIADLVCSGSADKTARVWRGVERCYSCLAVIQGHSGPVKCLTVISDQQILKFCN